MPLSTPGPIDLSVDVDRPRLSCRAAAVGDDSAFTSCGRDLVRLQGPTPWVFAADAGSGDFVRSAMMIRLNDGTVSRLGVGFFFLL
jgi:hypothetical protein